MSFITKKHLPRRTFLRGVGVAVGLPWLESMLPAQTLTAKTAPTRFGFIYVPHGAAMHMWTPKAEGPQFEFSPILSPLEPFRKDLLILSGFAHPMANAAAGDAGGDHSRSAAVYLSGARPKKTAGVDVYAGVTVDQIIAQNRGQETPMPSLELSIDDVGYTGTCGFGYTCAYSNTISWATPTKPLPMERKPSVVFERLFGDGSSPTERVARNKENRSILDAIKGDLSRLRGEIGPTDRSRLNDYLDDVREIERRLQLSAKHAATDVKITTSVGVPESYDEHVKLMLDLQALAYKADITRISTFMFARDQSGQAYPESGFNGAFHATSHHGNDPARMEQFAKINRYHAALFAYFMDKLRSTPDGDGSLLDHSVILYGSSMSNGNQHDHTPLPVLLAGGGSGKYKGGRHVRHQEGTTMSNLLLTILDRAGIAMKSFGDSTQLLDI